MSDFFYHASNKGNIKELLPYSAVRNSNKKVCYFTPLRAYALFYLRDMEINHVTCGVSENGIAVYYEQFPDQLKITYQGRSGYIYACENNDNIIKAHANGVWATYQPIIVTAEEHIEDVYIEMLKSEKAGDVQVIHYESLSEEKKQEIIIMMKNYIIENNFLDKDSVKARFWFDNYPQSWQIAKIEKDRS